MKLWTIQTETVYQLIQDTGVYRCDPYQSVMLQPMDDTKIGKDLCEQFVSAYDWLVLQMEKRIGPKPQNVFYPVWAWYQFGNNRKPDLRKERWSNGNPGEKWLVFSWKFLTEKCCFRISMDGILCWEVLYQFRIQRMRLIGWKHI